MLVGTGNAVETGQKIPPKAGQITTDRAKTSLERDASPLSIHLLYYLKIAGFRVFKIDYTAFLSGKSFQARMLLSPYGFAGLLSRKKTAMEVFGQVSQGLISPKTFKMTIDKRSYLVDWFGKEKIPQTKRSQEIAQVSEVAKLLTPFMFDPATTVLASGFLKPEEVCSKDKKIYNGREIFELRFQPKVSGQTDKKVLKCQVTYLLLAGPSAKTIEENRKDPPVFDVWIANKKTSDVDHPFFSRVEKAVGRLFGYTVTFVLEQEELRSQ